jgi:hypothetical protein
LNLTMKRPPLGGLFCFVLKESRFETLPPQEYLPK